MFSTYFNLIRNALVHMYLIMTRENLHKKVELKPEMFVENFFGNKTSVKDRTSNRNY